MIATIITVLFVLVGLINFIPVIGIVSAERLSGMYEISINEPNLDILMRHRALLFGLLGGFILYAAYAPHLRTAAAILAFISMAGFLVIAWQEGGYNAAIRKVAIVDVVGIVLLAIAVVLQTIQQR